ncbi:MAG: hypothetical protein GY853_10575 [PVC group bacterium]|nr:hypothetical protein [PVC group bacterium]
MVKQTIVTAVGKNRADGMMFSGGLDTSILAAVNPEMPGVNVSLENYNTDVPYAQQVVEHCNLDIHYKKISVEQAIEVIPEVIKILQSFDPGLPNDIAVYFGLKYAKAQGWKSIMTGDAADELFAGYSYMRDMLDLQWYIRRLSKKMFFNSNFLGDFFGIEIKQPFMDKGVIDCALSTPIDQKIRERDDIVHGKWILRKAFEDLLPESIAWQSKRPLEFGSGMTQLRKIISDRISDAEYEHKQKMYPVKFFCKEHLYFYEIYKEVVGDVPKPKQDEMACPGCSAGLMSESIHCRVCGWVKL